MTAEALQAVPVAAGDGEAPAATGGLTRQEIAAQVAGRLMEEWEAQGAPILPFTADVLGQLYATAYGLDMMLTAFDELGGMPGMGRVFSGMFGRRRRGRHEEADGG